MFSIVITYSCETVWVKVLLPKGWMVAVRNYSANTIMDKKQIEREGGTVKDNQFSGVKQKTCRFFWNSPLSVSLGHFELHFWLCQTQTRKTTGV